MNPSETPGGKPPSLADYIVRYDLAALLREAQQDYSQTQTGAPRLLEQKDIAARFRHLAKGPKKGGLG